MVVDETVNVTIAPGTTPSNGYTSVNIIDLHAAHTLITQEGALRKTAKQMGVTLEGKLHECKGCSVAKGICVYPIQDKQSRR